MLTPFPKLAKTGRPCKLFRSISSRRRAVQAKPVSIFKDTVKVAGNNRVRNIGGSNPPGQAIKLFHTLCRPIVVIKVNTNDVKRAPGTVKAEFANATLNDV